MTTVREIEKFQKIHSNRFKQKERPKARIDGMKYQRNRARRKMSS